MSKARVTWPEVLRALGRDETRSYATNRLAGSGFSADSFAHRKRLRELVADALTVTEDWLEMVHPKWPERDAIRKVRRRLEVEM